MKCHALFPLKKEQKKNSLLSATILFGALRTNVRVQTGTVKSLTDAWEFIRIIIFHEEGDGHLLEAIETCKSHMKVQNDQFLSNGRHLVFSDTIVVP